MLGSSQGSSHRGQPLQGKISVILGSYGNIWLWSGQAESMTSSTVNTNQWLTRWGDSAWYSSPKVSVLNSYLAYTDSDQRKG